VGTKRIVITFLLLLLVSLVSSTSTISGDIRPCSVNLVNFWSGSALRTGICLYDSENYLFACGKIKMTQHAHTYRTGRTGSGLTGMTGFLDSI